DEVRISHRLASEAGRRNAALAQMAFDHRQQMHNRLQATHVFAICSHRFPTCLGKILLVGWDMADDTRAALDALIRDSGEDYSSISRLLGRNPAYIQQFIKRGTPRRLAVEARRKLAAYFRVSEQSLGGRIAA